MIGLVEDASQPCEAPNVEPESDRLHSRYMYVDVSLKMADLAVKYSCLFLYEELQSEKRAKLKETSIGLIVNKLPIHAVQLTPLLN